MENTRIYGLEFKPTIEFDNYEGGVKLTRRLNIRNTTKNIIRFRFLFQSSSYFTFPLQELENISPGLNKSYSISFLNPLNDFQTICEELSIVIDDNEKDKKIFIKLKATPLKCDIIFPSILNFKEMVINQKNKEELVIKNEGSLNAIVKLSYKNLSKERKLKIKLSSSQFFLKKNEKKLVELTIYSEIPKKYKEFILCSIIELPKQLEKQIYSEKDDKLNKTMNPYENEEKSINDIIQLLNEENIKVRLIKKKIEINWISVLPQIDIMWEKDKEIFDKNVINFGQITLGQKLTKTIFLQNLANAPIQITARKKKENSVFTFLNEKFILKEKSKEEIILNIDGNNPVNTYTEIIRFTACNDYYIELFLICEIKNVKLSFSKTIYIFENIKLGDNINDKITIRNDENIDLDMEVINTGYFINIKNKKFTIKKNSFYSLNLICDCIYPINVHKRLYFLVHLNKQIYYIDIICNFSINYEMCPISMHHIYRYKHLIHDKEELYNSYYKKNDYIDIWDFPVEFNSYNETPYETLNDIIDINEKDVFIVPKELEVLEFEEKDLIIINKTSIEYTCIWSNMLDRKRKDNSIFEVTPIEAQLLPFSCQRFKVKNIKILKEKFVREIYECIVFPSNNKDYRKCNSKTLLPPLFLYTTFFQFKTKYLCEPEEVIDNLLFFPKKIFFLNLIEEENNYVIAKFENNTDFTQIIDFTQFKNDLDGIKIYPLISYVPKNSFLNVLIFYFPKKKELTISEKKIYYLVNGIEKKHISIFVSHEINNVVLNKGDLNIVKICFFNLPHVSVDTKSIKKVPIENFTERNVLCLLVKEDSQEIVNINIEGKKDYNVQKKVNNEEQSYMDEFHEETWENKEIELYNEENKDNFYYFSLLPFEKKNIYLTACCNFSFTESIPMFFTYFTYINDIDMKNKLTNFKKNIRNYFKSCKKFLINVSIAKYSLALQPNIIESKPIICGKKFNEKVRIYNEHPVKINFKIKTEIFQIDSKNFLDQEEITEAEKNIIVEKNEDSINSCSTKYIYVNFNSYKKGRFVYRLFVIVGENKSCINIILNVIMPYFEIVDINDFKTPTSLYWNMTSIDQINMYLKENITKIDRNYRKSQGMRNMKKLFNEFNYIEFNIGNNILNEITFINLILYNPLDITLHVHINTIKSYILPILPPYAKNQEEQLAHILFVDNTFSNYMRCLDSCEINPAKFKIKEKSTKTITILYKHKYIGFHNMPLIIDVKNGKIVPLNFISFTFHPKIPSICLMNIKDLTQKVLGLKNECIVNIDLLNDSTLDIYYDIEKNNNFIVLNPKGVIKKSRYVSIFIILSNLTQSTIEDTLIMNAHFKYLQKNIELSKIKMELKLNSILDDIYKNEHKKFNIYTNKYIYNIHNQNIKTFCSNFLPSYSYIHVKNKLFYISPSSINISCAPTNSIIERIIVIKNYSSLNDLKFKISNKNTLPENVLRISPNKGVVKKKEQQILRCTFILNDILLDIEGNIQIELKFINEDFSEDENEEMSHKINNSPNTIIEEIYEDTREEKVKSVDNKILPASKIRREKRFDDITFTHAQKIFDNIQMFKYTYDNINSSMLQKAIRRLYGVKNDDIDKKENLKESEKKSIKNLSKFYFYIHLKLFTCNFDDIKIETKNFEDLVKTNIYPTSLYFNKYINLPVPFEGKSKSLFKRQYFNFDKLEKFKIDEEEGIYYKKKTIYEKKDIYCYMFAEMFKSIIEKHIKKYIICLFEINECSIQTIESILNEDLIDIMTRNKRIDSNFQMEHDYEFLNPTILSHFFSDIFSDIINTLIKEKIIFPEKLN
ncbi:conserved Plasmodium protein, unknown function [Plasmodium gallinaceum]|uniref:CFAP65-like ninth Ig-like domain-containing protein n=1 Tax=Plasmodium gallinaceum TaxID=5849 RepID=A0A1J1GUY9_PLAGA|nr:conserved Plasmodium protein, unknown function [Plasmodium gallinaceum]CRG96274.1 conserved Plasmodium protein, unknown function [Plasmodium gallinaceum]